VTNHQCKVIDSAKEFQMANFIVLGVVDHVVMPYKLPTATNRDVINRDNVTRMTLSLVIIFCQNNNRRRSIRKDIGN